MKPVIFTGMHRSGTSAMARLARALGVNIGSNLLAAATGNVYGHFEEETFIRFHDRLIERLFSKRAPFCEWLPLADEAVTYTDADRLEAMAMWTAHSAAGGHGWKDPRTSLFLDLWTEVLPDAKIIICLRHPYQVHRSLLRRGEPFLHVDYSAGITGGNVYNQRILNVISKLPKDRLFVIDVELAFREPRRLAESVAQFLGAPMTESAVEAIDPQSFHFEDDCRDALDHFGEYLPEAEAAYRRLRQFDFLHPLPYTPAPVKESTLILSDEAQLIEFEERQGLRNRAKKMLLRSIAVDRQRTVDVYKRAAVVDAEKDRLIEDLARLTQTLKLRVDELQEERS